MEYVVIDLEMCCVPKGMRTKNYKWKKETIQIGAVLLNGEYEIVDSFMTYVSPRYGFITPEIERLTGISQNIVKDAPDVKDAFNLLIKWLPNNPIILAWSKNDEKQVLHEIKGKELDIPQIEKLNYKWIDLQELFSNILGSDRIYSLKEALNISNIDYNINFHDGLVDAENTAKLFKKIKTEDRFTVNEHYLKIDEEPEGLTTSLGSVLMNLKLSESA